ncbi:hypothetical protein L7F22_012290 [Adiantum nelumboides]|nr:hypothetical protein [Adiantum nelumboides]
MSKSPVDHYKKDKGPSLKIACSIFKGKRHDDPDVHIQAFEQYAKLKHIPEEEWGEYFCHTLKEAAKKWYYHYSASKLQSYKKLKRGFVLEYTDDQGDKEILCELDRIKQGKLSSVKKCVQKIKELIRRLNEPPSEKRMRAWFLSGFSGKKLREQEVPAPTKKFTELVHRAFKLEQQAKKEKSRHKASTSSSSSSESYDTEKTNIIVQFIRVEKRMEFWNSHPTESDLHFAQTINPIKPVETAQHFLLEADPLKPVEMAQNFLLEGKSLPTPAEFLTEIASDHVDLEILPQKKIKTEDPASPRCRLYGGWLQGLKQIAKKIPSGQESSRNAKLPELLNYVMVELEHKLALDDFKTQSSECSFWASIQDMAKRCGIDFCEFEKLCCFSFRDVTYAPDDNIPRLVDQGHDAPLSEFMGCSLAGYSNIASGDVFQQCPLGAAKDIPYTTSNAASFEQLPFSKLQRHMTFSSSVKHPELCMPGSLYSTFTTSKPTSLQISSTRFVPRDTMTPVEKQRSQCLSLYLNTRNPQPLLPATVPEACRRRIQRQRKRAMNYDHLCTNFGALTSSLAWNRVSTTFLYLVWQNNVVPSDLQFLLQKELQPSDVGSLGRIILPKRQAEEMLPHLDTKEGLHISFKDLQSSQTWKLRFRFWPNNKTRMYLLESTGSFVKWHHLRQGDFIVIYRNPATGSYVINGKKAACSRSERRSLPSPNESVENDESSFGPVENEPVSISGVRQLVMTEDEREGENLLASDIWDMEDPGELIKGFSDIGEDGGSIAELFV